MRFLILNSEAYFSQITATLDMNSFRSGLFPIRISKKLANVGSEWNGHCKHRRGVHSAVSLGTGKICHRLTPAQGNQPPQAPCQRNGGGLQSKIWSSSHLSHCKSLSEGARPSADRHSKSETELSPEARAGDTARDPDRKYPVHWQVLRFLLSPLTLRIKFRRSQQKSLNIQSK